MITHPTQLNGRRLRRLAGGAIAVVIAAVLAAAATPAAAASARTAVTTPAVAFASRAVGPMASITFDDGSIGQYTYGRPALSQRGMKGTFYIISDALTWGTATSMDATRVRTLATEGHEIGNHTRSHAQLTTLSRSAVTAQFADAQQRLQAAVGVRPTTCAYPHGSYNATVVEVAGSLFKGCRSTGGGLNSPMSLRPFSLTTYYVTSTTTAAAIQNAANQAKASNAWIIFTYHRIDPNASGETVTPSAFNSHLDALRNTGIPVRTVTQALQAYGR